MEIRDDGYSYFIDYGFEDDEIPIHTEFKFKSLGDGNVEAYERDVSNPFIATDFNKIDTRLLSGQPNTHLKNFLFFMNKHLDVSLHRNKTKVARLTVADNTERNNSTIRLRNDYKKIMAKTGINFSDFIESALEEKFKREGLL